MATRITLLMTTLATSAFVAGCNVHDTTPHATERAKVYGPRARMVMVPPNADDYEKDFLHRMIDHQETTLTLLRIAQNRTTHPALRQAAEAQIAEKLVQQRQMQSYASQWYWWKFPPHVTDDMKAEVDRLSGLSADAFDRTFLEAMVRQDRGGIEIAQSMVKRAPHAQAREIAHTLVSQLTTEANEFSHQLDTRYGTKSGPASQ